MPASLSEIIETLATGSVADLRNLLSQKGVKWPKDPVMHPVWDLLDIANRQHLNAPDLPGKLEALLDFGTPVDFSLPERAKVSHSRAWVSHVGVPTRYGKGSDNFIAHQCHLLSRAAAIGRKDLIDVLLARGASIYATNTGGREFPIALKLAAENRQMDVLVHLIDPTAPMSIRDWKSWAGDALVNMPTERQDVLDLIIKTSPAPDNPKSKKTLLDVLGQKCGGNGNIQWLEKSPLLWEQLHSEPLPKEGGRREVISLWPIVLADALKRGVHTPIFKIALEHAKRTGQINQPVSHVDIPQWGWKNNDHRSGRALGWGHENVALPPLQTLLHEVARISYKSDYRRVLRVVRHLRAAGAALWVGDEATNAPATEGMLFEATNKRPRLSWLKKHPEFLLAHPRTGQTPIDCAINVAGVNHWMSGGVAIAHTNTGEDDTIANIASRAGIGAGDPSHVRASKSNDWAKWIIDGWKDGTLPLQGQALGLPLEDWVCGRHSLFTAWTKTTKTTSSLQGFGLHVAAQQPNPSTIERLLELGHDPARLDDKGWSPLAHLAACTHRLWDGDERNAFKRAVDLLAKTPWPGDIPGQTVDPWQITLSHDNAYKFLLRDADPEIAPFFWNLHESRMKDETQWTPKDSTLLLRHFYDYDQLGAFSRLLSTLPQKMLNDMALCLFDPNRWPEGAEDGFLSGPHLLSRLLSKGADLNGVSIGGKRISDTWGLMEAHEDRLRKEGKEALRDAISLLDLPQTKIAVAAIEGQDMEKSTPASATSTLLRRRL